MSDCISPYSWPEILDRFPLDYSTWLPVLERPPGRRLRDLDDKAGQYGDLLEHGDTYVLKPGNVMLFSRSTMSGTTSYTLSGITSASTGVSFTAATSS